MTPKTPKARCLSDDEVAAYVDGMGGPGLRKRVEHHLARCNVCLHSVAEMKQLVGAEAAREALLPGEVLARAESLIAREMMPPELELVAAVRSGICKIIETTGRLLTPGRLSPVQVRGGKTAPTPKIAKSLSGYLVTLELVPGEQGVQPRLTLVEEVSSARPDGIKARLDSPEASETKYSRGGRLSFAALSPGAYRIEIEEIGRISLDIR
jgi:hypothetical protein